jgi:hypothetical protein
VPFELGHRGCQPDFIDAFKTKKFIFSLLMLILYIICVLGGSSAFVVPSSVFAKGKEPGGNSPISNDTTSQASPSNGNPAVSTENIAGGNDALVSIIGVILILAGLYYLIKKKNNNNSTGPTQRISRLFTKDTDTEAEMYMKEQRAKQQQRVLSDQARKVAIQNLNAKDSIVINTRNQKTALDDASFASSYEEPLPSTRSTTHSQVLNYYGEEDYAPYPGAEESAYFPIGSLSSEEPVHKESWYVDKESDYESSHRTYSKSNISRVSSIMNQSVQGRVQSPQLKPPSRVSSIKPGTKSKKEGSGSFFKKLFKK